VISDRADSRHAVSPDPPIISSKAIVDRGDCHGIGGSCHGIDHGSCWFGLVWFGLVGLFRRV